MPLARLATAEAPEALSFRGLTEELLEALGETFRGGRLFAALVGMAISVAAALALGGVAGVLLGHNMLAEASVVAILAGLVLYAGLLLTYAALCRMAAGERHAEAISLGAAYGFAFSRFPVTVGLPLFTLLVTLGLGALGMKVGQATGSSEVAGPTLGPVVLAVLFVINGLLLLVSWLVHALAAPCVASTGLGLAEVGERLVRVVQERLHQFLGYQTAILVVVLPLLVLTTGLFAGAFQPAYYSIAHGRIEAEAARRQAETPGASLTQPTATPPPAGGIMQSLRQRMESEVPAAGGAPLIGLAAMLLLLLGVVPLAYLAEAETAAYLGLSGDLSAVGWAGGTERLTEAAPVPAREKHPPIVHCWACDAINRYDAAGCAKCGVPLTVCPQCFATNQIGRPTCGGCGRPLPTEAERVEEAEPAGRTV